MTINDLRARTKLARHRNRGKGLPGRGHAARFGGPCAPPLGLRVINVSGRRALVSQRASCVTNSCHAPSLRPPQVSRGEELDHTRLRIGSPAVAFLSEEDKESWCRF